MNIEYCINFAGQLTYYVNKCVNLHWRMLSCYVILSMEPDKIIYAAEIYTAYRGS